MTRDDLQRRFLTIFKSFQHCCDTVPNGCNLVPTLLRCIAQKNRRCESSRVTSPSRIFQKRIFRKLQPPNRNEIKKVNSFWIIT